MISIKPVETHDPDLQQAVCLVLSIPTHTAAFRDTLPAPSNLYPSICFEVSPSVPVSDLRKASEDPELIGLLTTVANDSERVHEWQDGPVYTYKHGEKAEAAKKAVEEYLRALQEE